MCRPMPPSPPGRSRTNDPSGKGASPMKNSTVAVIGAAIGTAGAHALELPFPGPGDNLYLDLIAHNDPGIHTAIRLWYYAAPGVAVILAGSLALSVWRVWLQPLFRFRRRGKLPKWPTSPNDDAPSLVIGETHHPTVARESERPSWLVVPEKGLYTGVLVVGAVGTGKTTACMYPFAKQLLSWRADDPRQRAGALVLEVKGDFCHQVRSILDDAGRTNDYIEIRLGGSWQWNPLDDPLLDSYSLAYGVASLINQLFGKSREPFWQQAYTNLVRWIVEVHRLLPGGWVTLRDIYRCTVDAELLGRRIGEARKLADRLRPLRAVISHEDMIAHPQALEEWAWERVPGTGNVGCRLDSGLESRLDELGVAFEIEATGGGAGREVAEQVEAIERWYSHDWMALDAKLRTSIVEGISVFLSLFDLPEVAGVFCPPPPAETPSAEYDETNGNSHPVPGLASEAAAARAADRRRQGPRPEHARRSEPGARTRRRRASQECLDAGAAPAARRGRAPSRTATCGPPCSSAMSTKRLLPSGRTTLPAMRRRSRLRGSAAASRSSPRSRSPRSARCFPRARRGARSSRRSAPGSSCRFPTRRRPGSRPRCAAPS